MRRRDSQPDLVLCSFLAEAIWNGPRLEGFRPYFATRMTLPLSTTVQYTWVASTATPAGSPCPHASTVAAPPPIGTLTMVP